MNVQETVPSAEPREDRHHGGAEASSPDDRLLVTQAKSGRSSAFGELYERHRLKIYRGAFRILRNRQDAEDAVQRSFQRAFMNLGGFREDSAFLTWVTRIAINEALMLLRQRRADKPLSDNNFDDIEEVSILDLTDKRPTPEQALAEHELRANVLQAISQLRESLRTVVLLRELQELTSVETAQRLGLSVSAVKARMFLARRYLRQHFDQNYKAAPSGFVIGTRNK